MRLSLEQLEDRCSPGGLGGPSYVVVATPPWNPGTPPVVRFTPYPGEAAGSAGTAEQYDGLPWYFLTRLDHHLLKVYRAFHPKVKLFVLREEELPMPQLVDEAWQEAATDNAKRGYPWAVWGFREGFPGVLLDSKKTREEADRFATHERISLRPRGAWLIIVVQEEVNHDMGGAGVEDHHADDTGGEAEGG